MRARRKVLVSAVSLMIAPAAFFYGLWRNTDLSHIAYIMWPLADLMWTPWLIRNSRSWSPQAR